MFSSRQKKKQKIKSDEAKQEKDDSAAERLV